MSVFPNAKAQLLGAPEDSIAIIDQTAVAGLAGDLVMSKVLDSGQSQFGGTTSSSMVNGRATFGVVGDTITFSNITTPTEKSTLVIVVGASNLIPVSGNFTKNWLLKRDTTTIDSFSLISADPNSIEVDLRIFTDSNPPAGTFDYHLSETDANTYGTITAQLFFIEGADTHAGIISTPATAIKQINAADSHATQESGVIS